MSKAAKEDEKQASYEPSILQNLMKKCQGNIIYDIPNEQTFGCGTGYLISENLILTPASNIYDKANNAFHSNIEFQFTNSQKTKTIPCKMENIYVSEEYMRSKKPLKDLHDYSLIKLEEGVSIPYTDDEKNVMSSDMTEEFYRLTLNELKQEIKVLTDKNLAQENEIIEKNKAFDDLAQEKNTISIQMEKKNQIIEELKEEQRQFLMLLQEKDQITEDLMKENQNIIKQLQEIKTEFVNKSFKSIESQQSKEKIHETANSKTSEKFIISKNKQLGYQEDLMKKNQNIIKQLQEIKTEIVDESFESMESQEEKEKIHETANSKSSEKFIISKNKQLDYQLNENSYLCNWAINSIRIEKNIIKRMSGTIGICQKISLLKPLNNGDTIKFKMIKYEKFKIVFGLLSENQLYERFSGSNQKESIGYWVDPNDKDGWITINGNKLGEYEDEAEDLFVNCNQTITMSISLDKSKVNFIKGMKTFSCKLENSLKTSRIYPFVGLWGNGNEIEITYGK